MYKSEIRPSHNVHNETKYDILHCLTKKQTFMSPREISEETSLSYGNVCRQLTRLVDMGYIYRRNEFRKGYKNYYCYGYPKPKGLFFLDGRKGRKGADYKVKARELTGKFVSLRKDIPIPQEIINEYEALKDIT